MTTLVLLPGMDGTGDLFAAFAAELNSQDPALDVVIVRYPVDQRLGYAPLVDYARSQLPADGPFVLLGESFSGPVAISLAAASPPGLAGLILCCTFASNPAPLMRLLQPLITRLDHPPAFFLRHYLTGNADAALVPKVLAALARLAPGVLGARAAAVLDADANAALARLQVPVLYLRAMRDRLVSRRAAEDMRRRLPAMHIADFDTPHLLLQTRPREAAAGILHFIASVRA